MSEKPIYSEARKRRLFWRVGLILAMFVVCMIVLFWLYTATMLVYPRDVACLNQLSQLGMACLMSAAADDDKLPPAYTTDNNGKPLHNWRVLILSWIDRDLYKKIRLDEPWDSEYNSQFHDQMPSIYACPSVMDLSERKRYASYAMIVGDGAIPEGPERLNWSDVKDGRKNTILLVETKKKIPWMKPEDLSMDELAQGVACGQKEGTGVGSRHPKRVSCVMMDGTMLALDLKTSVETLKAMATYAGGEEVTIPNE